MARKSLLLPVLLPGGEECARCTAALKARLLSLAGVSAVEVDPKAGRLLFTHDPARISAEEIEQAARAAGAEIVEHQRHETLVLRGMDCADCAKRIERTVAALPGVAQVSISFATSRLQVEYDARRASHAAIARAVTDAGYQVEEARAPIQTGTLQVGGMDCADCALKIERSVMALPGARAADINFALGHMDVRYDPSILSLDQVARTVREAGYEARVEGSPTRDPEAPAFWQKNTRLALTILSGAMLLGAFMLGLFHEPKPLVDAFYIAAILLGGYHVTRSALVALRTRLTTDINFLMLIAVIGALFIGQWSEGASVIFLFSVAELLESYSMDRTRNAIRELMRLAPQQATVRRDGKEIVLPVEEILPGEMMVVKPGERIAMDGTVLGGASLVNQAPITGEPLPVEKKTGDDVFGGSINGRGSLEVVVSKPYEDTTMARVIHLVEAAQAQKARSEQFVDRFARIYTPTVILLAALVAVIPPLLFHAGFSDWFYRALALLIISCPCALVISTPVSIVSAIAAAARAGVLVKGGISLEEIGRVRVVAFDKTGTLTRGAPEVLDLTALDGRTAREVLSIASAIESRSEHALAEAILRKAYFEGVRWPEPVDFESLTGQGARARVDGESYYVGRPGLFGQMGVSLAPVRERIEAEQARGNTVLLVGTSERLVGLIVAADRPRAAARAAIRALKESGIERTVMLTGDNAGTAAAIARELGIDEYRAELLPQEKVEAVHDLLARYGHAAMVGDGVNDAPALAASSVGIAMGAAGTDVALETADVALMSDDLSRLPLAVSLSRKALRVIRQNIIFAIAVKAVFVAITLAGYVTLWLAVVADMGTSLVVTANGLRLLRSARNAPRAVPHSHDGHAHGDDHAHDHDQGNEHEHGEAHAASAEAGHSCGCGEHCTAEGQGEH